MAQKGVQLDQQTSCLICQDLLKDLVTIPCGHSFCMNCITNFWNEEDQEGVHSCPQCRETFTSRPDLVKSTMMAALVEQPRKTGLKKESLSVEEHKGHKTGVRPEEIQQRIQDREEDVKLLQQEVEKLNGFADKSVKESGMILDELILLIKKRSFEVKQQIRSQQETEVSRVRELQEKLQQEMTELKRKDAELKQLSHTEDHYQFLHKYSLFKSESLQVPKTQTVSLRYFEDVTAAVSELRDKLQDVLRDTWTNISQLKIDHFTSVPQSELKSRAELLQYSCEITLDPNTVNSQLLLSEEDKRATLMREEQLYPDHPERFVHWRQVLSREGLTGRCYWEVEWKHKRVTLAVVYKNISREGTMRDCVFGFNDKSWALECNCSRSFKFRHNSVKTSILGPWTSRIGVFLDHSAGVLSFYSVSETMTLLHRVQTTFTQPLHAGIWFNGYNGATAKFIQPE